MKYVNVPFRNSNFGILRWISKRIEVKDLYGNSLVNLSADSSGTDNIAAPIGYVNDGITWWTSNYEAKEHFYIVDLKTFRASIYGFSLIISTIHYHKLYTVFGSNDGIQWDSIKEANYPIEPLEKLNYILFDSPMNYRFYKISVNGINYEGNYRLIIGTIDFYGTLLWNVAYTCKHQIKRHNNIFFVMLCIYNK